jgi:hypothetical protein
MIASADGDYDTPALPGRSTGNGLYLRVEDVDGRPARRRCRCPHGLRARVHRVGQSARPRPRPGRARVELRQLRARPELGRSELTPPAEVPGVSGARVVLCSGRITGVDGRGR